MSGAGCCGLGPNSYLEQTKKSGGLRFCLPELGEEGLQPFQLSVSASRALSTGRGSAVMVPVTFHMLLGTPVCLQFFFPSTFACFIDFWLCIFCVLGKSEVFVTWNDHAERIKLFTKPLVTFS